MMIGLAQKSGRRASNAGASGREGEMANSRRRRGAADTHLGAVAGNGLLDRRALLGRGLLLAGAMGAGH